MNLSQDCHRTEIKKWNQFFPCQFKRTWVPLTIVILRIIIEAVVTHWKFKQILQTHFNNEENIFFDIYRMQYYWKEYTLPSACMRCSSYLQMIKYIVFISTFIFCTFIRYSKQKNPTCTFKVFQIRFSKKSRSFFFLNYINLKLQWFYWRKVIENWICNARVIWKIVILITTWSYDYYSDTMSKSSDLILFLILEHDLIRNIILKLISHYSFFFNYYIYIYIYVFNVWSITKSTKIHFWRRLSLFRYLISEILRKTNGKRKTSRLWIIEIINFWSGCLSGLGALDFWKDPILWKRDPIWWSILSSGRTLWKAALVSDVFFRSFFFLQHFHQSLNSILESIFIISMTSR